MPQNIYISLKVPLTTPLPFGSIEPQNVDMLCVEPVDIFGVEPVDIFVVEPVDIFAVEPVDIFVVEPVDTSMSIRSH